ncbi:antitoxin [Brevibacterium casei]|uniref:antitoxin n=1 Tax=Brevibacterium casei TaxID=33889 RepID=UPI002469B314|nr:antitoxin [Brevibacterium casei]MDH5148244.1 antitoxin [Brevibacterium casei]
MAFDKFLNKAKNLANDPKVREKLNSEKMEKFSDQVLDKAAGAADSLTKGKYSDKIKGARDAADRAIGTDGRNPDGRPGNGPDVRPGPGPDVRPGTDSDRPQTHRPDGSVDPRDPRNRPDAS